MQFIQLFVWKFFVEIFEFLLVHKTNRLRRVYYIMDSSSIYSDHDDEDGNDKMFLNTPWIALQPFIISSLS